MRFRRKAREIALQMLFQKAFHENRKVSDLFEDFFKNFLSDPDTREYALFLTKAVMDREEELNKIITEKSENWSLDRMAMIDKILLQMAILELCFSRTEDNSPKLVITDIIDLARKYSSEDSRRFINGILDAVYNQSSHDPHIKKK